jgi:hypothetical protein
VQPVWLWKCLVNAAPRHANSAGDVIDRNLDVGRLEERHRPSQQAGGGRQSKLQSFGLGLVKLELDQLEQQIGDVPLAMRQGAQSLERCDQHWRCVEHTNVTRQSS